MEIENRAERLLPLAGVAFTALMVLAAVAFPMVPGGDISPGKNPAWLTAHHDSVVAQGYVRALAAVSFVVLAVGIAAVLRRRGVSPAATTGTLAGGFGCGLLLLLAQAAGIGSALAAGDGAGAGVVRSLGYGEDALLTLSSLPAVVLFAASGGALLRTQLVPRWVGWATIAGVPFALLDCASYDGGPFESVGILGLGYFLLWSLAVGVSLLARRPAPHAEVAPVSS